ncbi:hypothetical protein KO481_29895 [Nocardia sp. NEAU-G5]|uniref:Uncharacterized protein n=1 Tax=Nocardia albiluteola TaxID=2842303 RepID=A0ABS6B5X3_9NOCA|nr:hypothetical protein [Nocardia albiluteola]MBU3065727.1 hypothetical protein [Nocardia albiluteola]
MPARRNGSTMLEGRVVCDAPGGVTMVFRDGPGEPLAVAARGEGRGARWAILLGHKNSRYRIGYLDGGVLLAEPADETTLALRRGDGSAVGTIVRGETTTAVAATGGTLFHFVPDPGEAATRDLFRLVVLDRMGAEFGRIDLIREASGWASHRLADSMGDTYLWWDRTGGPEPVPILGARVVAEHPLDRVECDVLLTACTDMALGLRPYIAQMRSGCTVGP